VFPHERGDEPEGVRYSERLGGEAAERIKAKTGLDVTGYAHGVDSFAIAKILKDHGTARTEHPRGQSPVTRDDFLKIPDIVAHFDDVEYVGKDGTGNNDLIRYRKRYNGNTYYVEEVRSKRRELMAKTLWKTRTAMAGADGSSLTSGTLDRNSPQGDSTIAPAGADGKVRPALGAASDEGGAQTSETDRAQPSSGKLGIAETLTGAAESADPTTTVAAPQPPDATIQVRRGPEVQGTTPDVMRSRLQDRFGRLIDRLERRGWLKIVNSSDTSVQPTIRRDAGIWGYWDGNAVWLLADRTPADRAVGLFLHEAGEHGSLQEMLGARYEELVGRFRALVEAGDSLAASIDRNVRRAIENGEMHPLHADSERLAYLIEHMANLPRAERVTLGGRLRLLYRDLLAALRAWFFRSPFYEQLRKAGFRLELTPEDILALARQAVRWQAAQTGEGWMTAETEAARARRGEEARLSRGERRDEKWLLAPNGKPSKLNEMQWRQVRTPEFKAWFGDWEQHDQPAVPATELTGDEIGGGTPQEARRNAREFVGRLIRTLIEETGTDTLHNDRTGFDIRLTEKGVVHGFQHQGPQHVKAVAGIRGLIENAAKIATMPHEPANDNFASVHTLVAPLRLADRWYAVKLTVKETWDGKMRLYDHQALDMKKPDGISGSTSVFAESIHRPASGSAISIAHLLTAFKGENSKYLASKVVDENGEPLVVYHGTAADVTFFDKLALGANTEAKSARGAFFFAKSPVVASGYAALSELRPSLEIKILQNAAKSEVLPESLRQFIAAQVNKPLTAAEAANRAEWDGFAGRGWDAPVRGANVLPLFLAVKNPLIVDYNGTDYRDRKFSKVIEEARQAGNDGVIFMNAEDSMHRSYAEITDIVAVFDPSQIKSAIGNAGGFSSDSPDIRYSRQNVRDNLEPKAADAQGAEPQPPEGVATETPPRRLLKRNGSGWLTKDGVSREIHLRKLNKADYEILRTADGCSPRAWG
jgi:hypothetical protein